MFKALRAQNRRIKSYFNTAYFADLLAYTWMDSTIEYSENDQVANFTSIRWDKLKLILYLSEYDT